jgi:hypothetical protein
MISGILAWFSGKGTALALGAALPVAFMLGKKLLPKYAASIFSGILGKGMANIDKLEDPKEKELVHAIALAVVKYVEFKIPEGEAGKAKFKIAAQKLCALLPFLAGREADMQAIIENAVAAMDAELKKMDKPIP